MSFRESHALWHLIVSYSGLAIFNSSSDNTQPWFIELELCVEYGDNPKEITHLACLIFERNEKIDKCQRIEKINDHSVNLHSKFGGFSRQRIVCTLYSGRQFELFNHLQC